MRTQQWKKESFDYHAPGLYYNTRVLCSKTHLLDLGYGGLLTSRIVTTGLHMILGQECFFFGLVFLGGWGGRGDTNQSIALEEKYLPTKE